MTKFFILTTLFLVFSIAAFAQTPAPTPPDKDDTDVVKISTSLIQVDATVLDKNGKIVKGLTADDFEIYENGKPQKITNFSFIELQPAKSNTTTEPVKRDKKSPLVPMTPTNLRPEQVRRTIALVVDDLGLSFGSVSKVKTALKKYVDEQMQPGDLAAIVRTGGGAGFLQQFTSDKTILYRAIEKLRWNPGGSGKISDFPTADPSDNGAPARDPDKNLPDEVQQNIREQQARSKEASRAAQNLYNSYREDVYTVASLAAVDYVVKGMGELPGRKALVLFSEGFALYDFDNGIKKPNPRLMANFQRLTEQANRASVIIYAMDTRGVVNAMMLNGEDNFEDLNRAGGTNAIEQVAIGRSTDLFETQQGLRELARTTGGFAVINNNNLGKGIERVLNDQSGYYLIGYEPDEETFNAKTSRFNKLEVRLKKPDLRVRYRSGFFGIEDKTLEAIPKSPAQQMLAALTSPFNSSAINLNLSTFLASDAKDNAVIRSIINIDAKDLSFTPTADGKRKANIDVVAVTFGETGESVEKFSKNYTITLTEEQYQVVLKHGFIYDLPVPVKKNGVYQFRIAVRDSATDKIGSASNLVQVPKLSKDFALSGIVLEIVNPQNSLVTAIIPGSRGKSDEDQMLNQSDIYQNMALRKFKRRTAIRYGYLIYNAKLDPQESAPLQVQTKLFSDGKLVFETTPKVINTTGQTDLRHLENIDSLMLGSDLPAGDYILQVIVTDTAGRGKNRSVSQWIDFQIAE
ncbi:MAG TPA: VWA domain-containing protein [Pyrinomonadaceae bacterium]